MDKGIKVLLIYANSFMDNLIPLGVSILSSSLKKAGHETKLFDTTFYKTREKSGEDSRVETLQIKKTNLSDYGIKEKKTDMILDFKKMINDFDPRLIAVSTVEPTYPIAKKALESIVDINVPKIMGGPLMTFAAEEIIREPFVDILCIGEGEGAIVDLANAIRDRKDYSNTKNLWIKKNGKIIKNPLRPLISLDESVEQDWSIFERERFLKPMGGKIRVTGNFEFSRGCNYNCAFCVNDAFQKTYKKFGEGSQKFLRYKSTGQFIKELREKVKIYGLEYIYIVAENFLSMPKEMFEEFVDSYKSIKIPFWMNTRAETINEERIRKLEEINCVSMSIGIEHGNEEFRKEILRRNMNNDVLKRAFKILNKSKIHVSANNIIGFPDETRELVFDTIKLNKELNPDNIIANIFNPYRGTRLYSLSVERGYYPKTDLAGDNRIDPTLRMPQLTPEQIKGLQRTFLLYARFPEERWPEIKIAEEFNDRGNRMFQKLREEYKRIYLK